MMVGFFEKDEGDLGGRGGNYTVLRLCVPSYALIDLMLLASLKLFMI